MHKKTKKYAQKSMCPISYTYLIIYYGLIMSNTMATTTATAAAI